MSWSGHQLGKPLKFFCFTAVNRFFFNLCQTRTCFRLVVVIVVVIITINFERLLIMSSDIWDTGNKYLV